jgi:hypothetical protein
MLSRLSYVLRVLADILFGAIVGFVVAQRLRRLPGRQHLLIFSALISGLTASCTRTSGSANVAAQAAAAIAAVPDSSCATLNRLNARKPESLIPSEQYTSVLAASHARRVCLLSAPDTVARRMSAGLAVNNLITLEVPHDARLWSTVRLKWLRYTRPGEYPIEGARDDLMQHAVTIPYEVLLVRWGSGWKAVRVAAVGRRDDR